MIDELWISVLWRAAYDALGRDGVDESIQVDAQKWFHDRRTYIGSFLWICFSFDINPDYLRRKLLGEARLPEGRQRVGRPRQTFNRGLSDGSLRPTG